MISDTPMISGVVQLLIAQYYDIFKKTAPPEYLQAMQLRVVSTTYVVILMYFRLLSPDRVQ